MKIDLILVEKSNAQLLSALKWERVYKKWTSWAGSSHLFRRFLFLLWLVLPIMLQGIVNILYKRPRLFLPYINWYLILWGGGGLCWLVMRGYRIGRMWCPDKIIWNAFILSFKCSFPFVFAVTSYGVTEELYLSWKGGRVSLWENFSSLQGDILSLLIWLVLR